MAAAKDPLKDAFADAALSGAGGAIISELEGMAFVETIEHTDLRRQYRVNPREGGAPRYFSVIVKEHQ